jgi:hypothetical protein
MPVGPLGPSVASFIAMAVELRGFEPPTSAVRAPRARNVSALPRLTAEGPLDPTLVDAGSTCPSQGQGAAGE